MSPVSPIVASGFNLPVIQLLIENPGNNYVISHRTQEFDESKHTEHKKERKISKSFYSPEFGASSFWGFTGELFGAEVVGSELLIDLIGAEFGALLGSFG